MKIAAIQLNAILGDVEANLIKAEQHIRQAALLGAEMALLPEFFTSAIGFHEKMLDVPLKNRVVQSFIKDLSSHHNIIIGGSYLYFDGDNTYNLFELVFPNGEIFGHKKDIPTQFENCYYTDGDKSHILHTPIGNIGVALCWEMIRYDTIDRLSQGVDFVLAGSCWWDLPEDAPLEREPLRKYNQNLALQTPTIFAKLLNVPVVHANHCGKVSAFNFPSGDKLQVRQLVGATQIVDANGNVVAIRNFNEGEGIIISDLSLNDSRQYVKADKRYWIPDLPESYINAWVTLNPQGKDYYQNVSLPYYKNNA